MNLQHVVTLDAEYAAAFRTIRAAKNLFLGLVLLSLLGLLASVVLATFVGVLDRPPLPTTAPTTVAAEAENGAMWYYAIAGVMAASRVIAPLACWLAVLTLGFGACVSLLARSGGTAALVSALFWCLLLLALLAPWQNILPGTHMAGVTAGVHELVGSLSSVRSASGQAAGALSGKAVYYARFLGMPVIALLVWITVMVKFAKGYRRVREATSLTLPPPASRPEGPSA